MFNSECKLWYDEFLCVHTIQYLEFELSLMLALSHSDSILHFQGLVVSVESYQHLPIEKKA